MEQGIFEKVCSFAYMPIAYKTILVEDFRTLGYYLNNTIIGNMFISLIKKSGKNIGFIEEIILQNIFLDIPHDENQINFIKEKKLFNNEGILSFFQLKDKHWRLFYLNGKKVYILDPFITNETAQLTNTKKYSVKLNAILKQAYGQMEWLNNWEEGFIEHEKQLDLKSCGVHVVEMAEELLKVFPAMPNKKIKLSNTEKKIR